MSKLRAVTIVAGAPFLGDWLAGAELPPDPREMKLYFWKLLRQHAPAVTLAVGGIEVDLNQHTGMAEAHLHFLGNIWRRFRLDWLREFLRENVKRKRALNVSSPIPDSDRAYVVSYQFKFAPMEKYRWVSKNEGREKKRTGKVSLKGDAGRRALLWLDGHPPEAFIFTFGCKLLPGRLVLAKNEAEAET